MSSEHARAVRQSNLYEHEGISKSLLERVALLIRKSDEGEEPDPLEGWCNASQDTLAAMHGCSREEVSRQVAKFEQDGWLTIARFRDEHGHKRCHYAMTPEQFEGIQARKMEQDENGEYIRERDVSAVRGTKSRANLPAKGSRAKKPSDDSSLGIGRADATSTQHLSSVAPHPSDESSQSHVTNGHKAKRPVVTKPSDERSQYPWVSSVDNIRGTTSVGEAVRRSLQPLSKTKNNKPVGSPGPRGEKAPPKTRRVAKDGTPVPFDLDNRPLEQRLAWSREHNGTGRAAIANGPSSWREGIACHCGISHKPPMCEFTNPDEL
jgi:hypothetical protein